MPSCCFSVEGLKQVEVDALASAARSAPRVRVATPAPAEEQPEVTEEEELQKQETKDKLVARLLELRGTTQLSSMRAIMAKAVLKSIKARFAWREFPKTAPDDQLEGCQGTYSMERIRQYVAAGQFALLDAKKGLHLLGNQTTGGTLC